MLPLVDYDDKQHIGYAQGRRLTPAAVELWRRTFQAWAPAGRPLQCLDLGSGTGRFTPMLAELFGGPVYGVEPSDRMRAVAEAAPHPDAVTYLAGSAEHIPLPDSSCGLALMFLSFHHVRNRTAAAREVARVLGSEGRTLLRSTFADRMPGLTWHRFFPRARELELQMFPTVPEVVRLFGEAGLRCLGLQTVQETIAANLADYADRLRTRAISIFDLLTEDEIEEGFRRLDEAVDQDEGAPILGDSDFLVLVKD